MVDSSSSSSSSSSSAAAAVEAIEALDEPMVTEKEGGPPSTTTAQAGGEGFRPKRAAAMEAVTKMSAPPPQPIVVAPPAPKRPPPLTFNALTLAPPKDTATQAETRRWEAVEREVRQWEEEGERVLAPVLAASVQITQMAALRSQLRGLEEEVSPRLNACGAWGAGKVPTQREWREALNKATTPMDLAKSLGDLELATHTLQFIWRAANPKKAVVKHEPSSAAAAASSAASASASAASASASSSSSGANAAKSSGGSGGARAEGWSDGEDDAQELEAREELHGATHKDATRYGWWAVLSKEFRLPPDQPGHIPLDGAFPPPGFAPQLPGCHLQQAPVPGLPRGGPSGAKGGGG